MPRVGTHPRPGGPHNSKTQLSPKQRRTKSKKTDAEDPNDDLQPGCHNRTRKPPSAVETHAARQLHWRHRGPSEDVNANDSKLRPIRNNSKISSTHHHPASLAKSNISMRNPPLLNNQLVTAAIVSLYIDRIRPCLTDVLQRVKSRLKDDKDGQEPDSYGKQLQSLDVACLYNFIQSRCKPLVQLVPPPSSPNLDLPEFPTPRGSMAPCSQVLSQLGQAEALLLHPPEAFLGWVDPHSSQNPFPLAVWRSFWAFLLSRLSGSPKASPSGLMPYQFKGGRYGLAVDLKVSEFPILQQMRLGELCHLVQLAISGRMLAYERSVLQPVTACLDLSCVLLRVGQGGSQTETCQLTTALPVDRSAFASLDELAECVSEVLSDKPGGVVVAQLKKMLTARFQKEFIPERFGFRKLTDCLSSSSQLQAVCQVVCPHPSSHRLLLVHKMFIPESEQRTPDIKKIAPMMLSPGSISTAAGSDTSLCKTPDSVETLPSTMVDPPIMFQAMGRAATAMRPLSFLAWAHMSTLQPFLFSSSAPLSLSQQSEDDVPFSAVQAALGAQSYPSDAPDVVLPAGALYKDYWDCFRSSSIY